MIKLTKEKNGNIILNINNSKLELNFSENKTWLTKKEIASLFGIDKKEVKNIISQLKLNNIDLVNNNSKKIFNIETKKEKIYYSIDLIINLGYRLKNFTATKLLIKVNRILKNLNINRKSIIGEIFKNIVNITNVVNKKNILI